MNLIDYWRASIEPCVRLIFVALGLNIILLPLAMFHSEALPREFKIGLTILYVIIVVPILTEKWIRVCGFKLDKRTCGGGMNPAACAKQESLNEENKG